MGPMFCTDVGFRKESTYVEDNNARLSEVLENI